MDAGSLHESARQEPGTAVYTEDFNAEEVLQALADEAGPSD